MGDIDVWGRWNAACLSALVRFHIHTDFDFMLAPTLDYAAHRTNVTVIPAPGQRDVTLERDKIVGRIHVQPAGAGAIHGHPGVRSEERRGGKEERRGGKE